MRGQPLMFLGAVVGIWIGARVAMLWPAAEAIVARIPMPAGIAHARAIAGAAEVPVLPTHAYRAPATARLGPAALSSGTASRASLRPIDADILASTGIFYFAAMQPPAAGSGLQQVDAAAPAPGLPGWTKHAAEPARRRWALDAWTLLRPGPGGAAFGPQLGGSQAGARLAYFLDAGRRRAAYARVTSPLEGGGVEMAAGVQWQPTRLPVAAFAEARRRAGGAVVPVAGLVGGVYRAPIQAGWRLDGYGQAGVIGGKRREGFADGQLRVTRPAGAVGPTTLEAGLGTWGGIQRDAGRFDLGPTLGMELPVRAGTLRLTLDWRQRVAGHAAPASGPALTLAAGF